MWKTPTSTRFICAAGPTKPMLVLPSPTLNGLRMRIASKYIDRGESYEFATVKDEIVLRSTPARPIPDKGDLCRG
jgi:hypothetical protein